MLAAAPGDFVLVVLPVPPLPPEVPPPARPVVLKKVVTVEFKNVDVNALTMVETVTSGTVLVTPPETIVVPEETT